MFSIQFIYPSSHIFHIYAMIKNNQYNLKTIITQKIAENAIETQR